MAAGAITAAEAAKRVQEVEEDEELARLEAAAILDLGVVTATVAEAAAEGAEQAVRERAAEMTEDLLTEAVARAVAHAVARAVVRAVFKAVSKNPLAQAGPTPTLTCPPTCASGAAAMGITLTPARSDPTGGCGDPTATRSPTCPPRTPPP